MIKKIVVTLLFVAVLVAAGWTAPIWWPWLWNVAGVYSAQIEGLTGLVQGGLWILAALWFLISLWREKDELRTALTRSNEAQVNGDGGVAQDNAAAAGAGGQAVKAETVAAPVIGPAAQVEQVTVVGGDQVTHITHVYLSAHHGTPMVDGAAFEAALDRYLAWVEKRYGQLDLRGIERREQRVLSLTLDDVYVSLAVAVQPDRKERPARGREVDAAAEPRLVNMRELLGVSRRLVVIGGPGSGKTTYLQIVASDLARALRTGDTATPAQNLGVADRLPIPIFVSLSDFNRYRRDNATSANAQHGTLTDFISHALIRQESGINLPADFFARLLVQGRVCILLLDGLDEVADDNERQLVRMAVQNLANNGGVGHMLVASRTRAYREEAVLPEEFRVAEVQPMSPEQVDVLAARWCAAAYNELDATAEAKRLQQAIQDLEAVRTARGQERLIDSPLLVTIVAIVHYNERRLPEQRAELYEKCVEVLLTERHHHVSDANQELAGWGGTLAQKRSLLADLAARMMSAGEAAGRRVDDAQLREWLRPRLVQQRGEDTADTELDTFVRAMRERGSLLDERDGSYQFIHLTFQEFLAAFYLAEGVRDAARIVAFLEEDDRLADSWWRETVLLTVGYLGLRSADNALTVVQQLAVAGRTPVARLAAAELAAAALLDLDSRDPATRTLVQDRLVLLLGDPDLTVPGVARAAAGRTLGRLGDPRPGVGVANGLPDFAWVDVAGGPFTMGSDKAKDPDAYDDELPQFTCTLVQDAFQISRYPVTVAQYQAFVDAGGYAERRFWTKAGWAWRNKNDVTGPEVYDGVFQTPNHPQVGVSWYEAMAFCAWLREVTGESITLPTESQWERAARHTDGRIYPWGDRGDPAAYCNMDATGIGSTSAVGVFPQGDAECGAADMSGNVWEWCGTKWRGGYAGYNDAADDAGDGDTARVVRGGSFVGYRRLVRCAYRHNGDPNDRNGSNGCRVVRPPGP